MSVTFTDSVVLVREDCWVCGTPFAMSDRFSRHARATGETFYCPKGDRIRYADKTEAEKLREQLSSANARAERNLERVGRVEREKSALKGQMTKLKNRVHAGVCPHCRRSFASLRRHMAHMHPDHPQ